MADLAGAAGRVVAVPIAALTRLRGSKPMHPRGVVFDAVLERSGPPRPWGLDWLDRRGTDRVLVRLSRGAGLPPRWPDLLGLAVRLPAGGPDGAPVDLLLSSTGRGRWTRLLPVPRRDPATTYCSIMSYRSALGPLQLAALPDRRPGTTGAGGLRFTLAAARERGDWEPFARLELLEPVPPGGPELTVDAVLHPPPGMSTGTPMARFRRPAYAAARRARGVRT